jgi:hypothetical protein
VALHFQLLGPKNREKSCKINARSIPNRQQLSKSGVRHERFNNPVEEETT